MQDVNQLKRFMENHVYAVWDFMCLLKAMKDLSYSPTTRWTPTPRWTPPKISYQSMRLINEIYTCEETDEYNSGYASHMEIYLQAMKEVGADTKPFLNFLETLDVNLIPEPAKEFVLNTLTIIDTGELHRVVSAFAHGRELAIPEMFTKILDDLRLPAPTFRYYLSRHIAVDGENHGPASMLLLQEVADTPEKQSDVDSVRIQCKQSREKLWKELM